MVTVSGFTTSPDGYEWSSTDAITQPFLPRQQGVGIACATDIPWIVRSNGTVTTFNGVAWAYDRFIAVGSNGYIYTSTDGNDWIPQTSGVLYNLNSVIASNTNYVVVADSGVVLNSTDAVNWNLISLRSSERLLSVCWSSELTMFVAVGTDGILIISLDSENWRFIASNSLYSLNSVTWNGSEFLAVGNNGTICTSTDGLTWSSYENGITTANLYGICWTGTRYVAVGSAGVAITSLDGVNWSISATGISTDLLSVTWGLTEIVAVGLNNSILRSQDGISWYQDNTRFVANLNGVAYNKHFNTFVAVGSGGVIITSTINTVQQTITAISDSGYVSSSYDGIIWSNGSILFGNFSPYAISQGTNQNGNNSTFMIVGSQKYANNEPSHNQFDEVAQIFVSDSDTIADPGFEDSWTMVYAENSNDSRYYGVKRFAILPAQVITYPIQSGSGTNEVTVDQSSNPFLSELADLITNNPSQSVGTVTFSSLPNVPFNIIGVVNNGTTWTFEIQGYVTFAITDTTTFNWSYPDVWVVCGSSNGNPVLLYSLDDGTSWDRVNVPEIFNNNQFFDITYSNSNFYIAAYGYILYTPSLINPQWGGTDYVTANYASPNFTKIATNPSGHIVAVSSGLIYYSLDGAIWNRFEAPGYQFISVIWYIDHWVVGVRSLLTTYTYFTSTDTVTWIGQNNNIQMYDFAILP